MKKGLFLPGLFIFQVALAQPSVKLYGYAQHFTPGMVPQREIISEDGTQSIKTATHTVSYYIYIAVSSAAQIKPKELWIDGKGFTIKNDSTVRTPVITDKPVAKQLVPQTSLRVRSLDPGDPLPATKTRSAQLKKIIASSELVLTYTWKGKLYYKSLKKITVLDPVLAE